MVVKLHKYSSILSASLWLILGILTAGSIVISKLGWIINVGMGLLFIIIGCFMYFHGNSLHQFYGSAVEKIQYDPNFRRFLRLDLIFVLISCIFSGISLIAVITRIFFEGYAVFG